MRKIVREKNTVRWMIEFYCTKKHKNRKTLCEECTKLLKYSHSRLNNCFYGEEKNSCIRCITPCYAPEKREKIKKVMRYAAPRMIYYKPYEWIIHLLK